MSHFIRIVLLLVVTVALTPAATAQPGGLELEVDCDRGDSLYRALRRAERASYARIHVRGTCLGANVITGDNFVEIIGDPNGGAVLQSGPSPVLFAVGSGTLLLQDVRLVGGMGLRASGSGRVVGLTRCEIDSQSLGVFADQGVGALVVDSDIRALDTAVLVKDSQVVVQETRLHDSTFAARTFGGLLWLDRVEAVDNLIGVLAEDRSSLIVLGGQFSENGQGHLGGTNDTRIQVYNTQVGGPGDGTALSLSGDGGVAIEVFYDDAATDIWGGVSLRDDSFLSLGGATIHGSIQARGFSRVLVEGTVERGVGCGSAADAFCGFAASTTTQGCPSAPQVCLPAENAASGPSSPRIVPVPPQIVQAPPRQIRTRPATAHSPSDMH